ncbi:MAG: hypothetical protein HC838_14515 [Spirulinaceae cyanobacterium RM2_2_10]|nr:hypothetical protein [Spirulinaceae cyanobacterium SM2_1_0]NJO21002.1 hypothetical protein [Spirulinaceae cyanobacterium RM2_2_10]
MFILKRQDVEISSIQHPQREQPIPILKYQDQTFRLISVFNASQAEEAKNFWKDLTDNQGKFCVLLQESDRHSVWGRVRLDQLTGDSSGSNSGVIAPSCMQACLLLLQAIYFDVEELLGNRQAKLFEKEVGDLLLRGDFPQVDSAKVVARLLNDDPLESPSALSWQEQHLVTFLQALYGLGKSYFGNTNFAEEVEDILQDMDDTDRREFLGWLQGSPLSKEWG